MKTKLMITIAVILLLAVIYAWWWANKQGKMFSQALSNSVYKHHEFVVKTDTIEAEKQFVIWAENSSIPDYSPAVKLKVIGGSNRMWERFAMKLLPQDNFSTKQMNEELEYIMEKLNQEIDLRQLEHLALSLQDLGEETVKMAEHFTNEHEKHFGKYKEGQFIGNGYEQHEDYQMLKSVLQGHFVMKDIKAVFLRYGLYVSNVQIEKARFDYEFPLQTDKGRKILAGELWATIGVNNPRITKKEAEQLNKHLLPLEDAILNQSQNFTFKENQLVAFVTGIQGDMLQSKAEFWAYYHEKQKWVDENYEEYAQRDRDAGREPKSPFEYFHVFISPLTEEEKRSANGYDALVFFGGIKFNDRPKLLARLNERQNNMAMGVWESFTRALREENINYLLSNSLDTLQCTDCKAGNEDANHVPAREVFRNKNWLEKMILSNQNPSIHIDENQIKVSFSDEKSSKESSLTVFSFVYRQNKYLFEGMFTVP